MAEIRNFQLQEIWKNAEATRTSRGVPAEVQELLNSAFAKIPASNFPPPVLGRVVEIPSDATISEAVYTLASHKILSAPVRDVSKPEDASWADRYLGMVDYPAIVLWVLEQAELAAAALAAGTAAATGVGAGALGALGAVVLGLSGPVAIAGLTAAAVGAALAGGVAVERRMGKDPQSAAEALGEDFYKILLQEEPFRSTKVADITRSYRWAPFLAIRPDDSMLSVLLLLSKFRMRSIPVVEMGQSRVTNLITQSGVVRGLAKCRGFDWFDAIGERTLEELGLPLMTPEQVVSVDADHFVLEAFMLMRQKGIGGLPVVEGPQKTIFANVSVRDVQYLLLRPELFTRRKDLTVRQFVHIVTGFASEPSETSPILRPPITCKVTDTFVSLVDTLAAKHIHRIHVIDGEDRVVGVVTLRDIISRFVTEPKDYFKNFLGGLADEAGSQ